MREAITGVREQVNESLGDDLPELRDLDLRKYHPKTFIRTQLLGDDEPVGALDGVRDGRLRRGVGPPARPRDAAPVRPRRDVISAALRGRLALPGFCRTPEPRTTPGSGGSGL